MSSNTTTLAREAGGLKRFPIYPQREDMQNNYNLYLRSLMTSLPLHFRDQPNTLVHSETPVAPTLPSPRDYRIPDLMIAFDCDLELVRLQRGYALDTQGKPPEFALEVASVSTGIIDLTSKRRDYERYGISEYWRFDDTGGRFHDAALSADRLVNGRYRPIEIETLDSGVLRGHSRTLGLYICWDDGQLQFYDPMAERYLPTHAEDLEGRLAAESRAEAAESRAEAAELRNDQLEAEIRRLRGEE